MHSQELQQLDSLIKRMEAVEVGIEVVEQLWVVSRDEIHLSDTFWELEGGAM